MIWQLNRFTGGGAGQYAIRLGKALCALHEPSCLLVVEGETSDKVAVLELVPSIWRGLMTRTCAGLLGRFSTATFHTGYRFNRVQSITPIQPGDIVHLHGMTGWIGFGGLEALIPVGARVYWTAHDLWMLSGGCVIYNGCESYQAGCVRCPVLKYPLKRLSRLEFLRKARFIHDRRITPIANSQWTASRIVGSAMFPGLREVPVVPPIVDEAFFAPADPLQLRRKLEIALDRPVIGLGARALTDQNKGIGTFLARLSQCPELASRVTVILFGEGQLATHPGLDCRHLGPVDSPQNLADIYRACDVFVSASRMETFGMTLLEAQACGTAVVAFRTGGIPEAVCPEHRHGLVEPGDFTSLLDRISGLLQEGQSLQVLGQRMSNWVRENFSAEVVGRLQRRIYEAGSTGSK